MAGLVRRLSSTNEPLDSEKTDAATQKANAILGCTNKNTNQITEGHYSTVIPLNIPVGRLYYVQFLAGQGHVRVQRTSTRLILNPVSVKNSKRSWLPLACKQKKSMNNLQKFRSLLYERAKKGSDRTTFLPILTSSTNLACGNC